MPNETTPSEAAFASLYGEPPTEGTSALLAQLDVAHLSNAESGGWPVDPARVALAAALVVFPDASPARLAERAFADLATLLDVAAGAVAVASRYNADDDEPVVGGGYGDTTVTEAEAALARLYPAS